MCFRFSRDVIWFPLLSDEIAEERLHRVKENVVMAFKAKSVFLNDDFN